MTAIGLCCWKNGKLDEAYEYLVRSCELKEKINGVKSEEVANVIVNIANVLES